MTVIRRRVRLITLFVLAVCGVVSAQDVLALRGTVRDDVGDAVAGAEVTLTAQQPQQVPQRQWTTTSDANGRYMLEHLSPGRYLLSVSRPGFATTERSLEVTAGGAPNGDAILRLAIAEQVAVVSSLEDLRRVTGMRPTGLLLGPEQLDLLPSDPDMMLQVLQELSATSGRPDEVAVYVDGQPVTTRLPPREVHPQHPHLDQRLCLRIRRAVERGGGSRHQAGDEPLSGRVAVHLQRFRAERAQRIRDGRAADQQAGVFRICCRPDHPQPMEFPRLRRSMAAG